MKDADSIRVVRMSRHLYDLEKLMGTDHANQALADLELYQEIVTHRSKFYRRGHVDYQTLGPSTLDFVPPADSLQAFEADYLGMSETMFYGKFLLFGELITRLQELKQRFRNIQGT